MEFCPLSAAATEITGQSHTIGEISRAKQELGYRGSVWGIAQAADFQVTRSPRNRWMRAQMKKILFG